MRCRLFYVVACFICTHIDYTFTHIHTHTQNVSGFDIEMIGKHAQDICRGKNNQTNIMCVSVCKCVRMCRDLTRDIRRLVDYLLRSTFCVLFLLLFEKGLVDDQDIRQFIGLRL